MFENGNAISKKKIVNGDNDLSYVLVGDSLYLCEVPKFATEVNVPAFVSGYRVVGLMNNVFDGTEVEILNVDFGVTQIWIENLINNNLKKVNLPPSVVAILDGNSLYGYHSDDTIKKFSSNLTIYGATESQVEHFARSNGILFLSNNHQPLIQQVKQRSRIDQLLTPTGFIRIDESNYVSTDVFSGDTNYEDEYSLFKLSQEGTMEDSNSKLPALDIIGSYMSNGIDYSSPELDKMKSFDLLTDSFLFTKDSLPTRLAHDSKGYIYELENTLGSKDTLAPLTAFNKHDFETDKELESRFIHPVYEFKRSSRNSVALVGTKEKLPVNVELPSRIANMVVTTITKELFEGQEHIERLILPKDLVVLPNIVFTLPNLTDMTIRPYATVFEGPPLGVTEGLVVHVGIDSPALHYCTVHQITFKINPVLGRSLYDDIMAFKENPMLLKDSVRSRFHVFESNKKLLVRFGFSTDGGEPRYSEVDKLVLSRLGVESYVFNSKGEFVTDTSIPVDYIAEYLVSEILNDVFDKSTADNDGFVFDSYDSEEGETCLVAYVGDSSKVIVPTQYEDLKVTEIANGVFDASVIQELIIPDTVSTINYDILHNKNIKHIGLSNRVSEINRGNLPVISDEQMNKIKYEEGSITDMTLNRFL